MGADSVWPSGFSDWTAAEVGAEAVVPAGVERSLKPRSLMGSRKDSLMRS